MAFKSKIHKSRAQWLIEHPSPVVYIIYDITEDLELKNTDNTTYYISEVKEDDVIWIRNILNEYKMRIDTIHTAITKVEKRLNTEYQLPDGYKIVNEIIERRMEYPFVDYNKLPCLCCHWACNNEEKETCKEYLDYVYNSEWKQYP